MTSHNSNTLILGIESSCDDTAIAVVSSDRQILAAHTASSAATHSLHGGVVPEIAARQHLDSLMPTITATLADAGVTPAQLDGIAATAGPGLIGGVLVGTMAAKAMASALSKPYFAVNHLEGHALTARLTDGLEFPYLLLLVSGGHTQLLMVHELGRYERLGTTMDDAAGEAFDKAASLMGLGYPGGPQIERLAETGDASSVSLPRPRIATKDCHFSFSGLKTAFAQQWQKLDQDEQQHRAPDFAASLQRSIADALVRRTEFALQHAGDRYGCRQLVIAGGVAANSHIRSSLTALAARYETELFIPPVWLCTDNGAMIAWVAQEYYARGEYSSLSFAPRPRWPLDPGAEPPPGRGIRA